MATVADDTVARVREFNRFYTNVIGVLREGLLHSPYSLTEARVLYELFQARSVETRTLRDALEIDPGYLSRVIANLEAAGLLRRRRADDDARRHVIELTASGRRATRALDSRSSREIGELLTDLGDAERRRLVGAMAAIRDLLGARERPPPALVLRAPLPGELGWIVERHGALYNDEYGWDEGFEALVAGIVARYAGERDPRREAAWIAEVDGAAAGCLLCTRKDARTAQLRLLLVDPAARGIGIGARLVDECVAFARRAGYRRLVLWTNDVLVVARRIYEAAGFELVAEQPHHSFGHDLVGQDWRLALT